jgi:cytochrome c biogenesis protein CcmG/thiol:disulfide interchange protein DsbE
MRSGSWVVIVSLAALFGLLAYGVASKRTDTSIDSAIASGKRVEAPSATLPVLGGTGQGSLADYRGKVVVMNFWASWCPPCIEELPLLERTQRAIAPRNATVLGINYKDVSEDALAFVRRLRVSFPNLRDRDGRFVEKYGTRAFPETFVIDRSGRIAARRRGPVDQAWLDKTLAPLLAESA